MLFFKSAATRSAAELICFLWGENKAAYANPRLF